MKKSRFSVVAVSRCGHLDSKCFDASSMFNSYIIESDMKMDCWGCDPLLFSGMRRASGQREKWSKMK